MTGIRIVRIVSNRANSSEQSRIVANSGKQEGGIVKNGRDLVPQYLAVNLVATFAAKKHRRL